jgi:hypothetical protein
MQHGRRAVADSRYLQAGLGIYPFTEGKLEDLEEVFAHFEEVFKITLSIILSLNVS